jgi:hypothetical protein
MPFYVSGQVAVASATEEALEKAGRRAGKMDPSIAARNEQAGSPTGAARAGL